MRAQSTATLSGNNHRDCQRYLLHSRKGIFSPVVTFYVVDNGMVSAIFTVSGRQCFRSAARDPPPRHSPATGVRANSKIPCSAIPARTSRGNEHGGAATNIMLGLRKADHHPRLPTSRFQEKRYANDDDPRGGR